MARCPIKPFAQGGVNLAANLTLRCAAHNALEAEEDFGREYIEQKRAQARHESRQLKLTCCGAELDHQRHPRLLTDAVPRIASGGQPS
jgi:hypothetical protein